MGLGDDILVTAFAAKAKKKFPERQIVIGSLKKKHAHHSIVYENNPNIADCRKLDNTKEIHLIDYHPENRPYIDYENSTNRKYVWNLKYKAEPGELYFTKDENEKAKKIINEGINFWKDKNKSNKFKGIIFLETNSIKINHKNFAIKHLNKSWGENNWFDLVNELKGDYLFINSVHDHSFEIPEVFSPKSMDFRLACSIMNECDIYVGPEGGFSHVAGALNKKAVVYYGGWITPDVIGYEFHENLYFDHPQSPCGLYRDICEHCSQARKFITVDTFSSSIKKLLP